MLPTMDSLTQIALGACVAAVCVPAGHRRKALLAGAMLGTVPDLDTLPLLLVDDPVARMVWHRGFSHSLLVLPLLAGLLWWWLRSRWQPVREAPRHWFWAIQLALVTHPLLDAFTIYGTQLLWPLPVPPIMWSSLFIIDPGYSIWLLLAVVAAAMLGPRPAARTWLVAGLSLSSVYLAWSLVAKTLVEHQVERSLAGTGLADVPRFSVPMPLNTLLWRVVVMTPDGYLEGERSLVADHGPIRFRPHRTDPGLMAAAMETQAGQRLARFSRGFAKAEQVDGQLVISDLRMGRRPTYVFRFAIAEADPQTSGSWRAIPPRQLRTDWSAQRRLGPVWQRIWQAPDTAATLISEPTLP